MFCVNTLPAQITVNSNGDVKIADEINFNHYTSSVHILTDAANTVNLGSLSLPLNSISGSAIYANGILLGSDKRIKENFRNIDDALSKILLMKGQEYDFIINKSDSIGAEEDIEKRIKMKKDRLGFIAQELKSILPEAVYYDKDADQFFIEYTAIIPVIVEAMKEQQATIEKLTTKIEALETAITALKKNNNEKSATISSSSFNEIATSNVATLAQNIPNPFSNSTRIDIYLPLETSHAALYIYNMQGTQKKSYTIAERGNTSVIIEGYSLEAGIYLYTLIADGKEVDTKKMILTN